MMESFSLLKWYSNTVLLLLIFEKFLLYNELIYDYTRKTYLCGISINLKYYFQNPLGQSPNFSVFYQLVKRSLQSSI